MDIGIVEVKFVLKNWMRQWWNDFDSFRNRVNAPLKQCPSVYA